jgi:hypothetical protein
VGEEKEVLWQKKKQKIQTNKQTNKQTNARALVYKCCYDNFQLKNIKGCRYNGGVSFMIYQRYTLKP